MAGSAEASRTAISGGDFRTIACESSLHDDNPSPVEDFHICPFADQLVIDAYSGPSSGLSPIYKANHNPLC